MSVCYNDPSMGQCDTKRWILGEVGMRNGSDVKMCHEEFSRGVTQSSHFIVLIFMIESILLIWRGRLQNMWYFHE